MNIKIAALFAAIILLVVAVGYIAAVYTMQSNHVTGPVTSQATLNVTVNGSAANGTSYVEGSILTVTATTSDGSAPSGAVTFLNGATIIGTATASGNSASFQWTIPVGTTSYDLHATGTHP